MGVLVDVENGVGVTDGGNGDGVKWGVIVIDGQEVELHVGEIIGDGFGV